MRYGSVNDLPEQHRAQAEALLRGGAPAGQCSSPWADIHANLKASTAQAVLGNAKPKRTKYRNVRVYLEGQWFDSRLEYDLWCVLHARMKAGEIAYIKRQATFVLEGGVRYRADYECVLTLPYAIKAGACSEVWDAKGRDTQASQNKRKQVKARYGVDVRLWTKADRKRGAA